MAKILKNMRQLCRLYLGFIIVFIFYYLVFLDNFINHLLTYAFFYYDPLKFVGYNVDSLVLATKNCDEAMILSPSTRCCYSSIEIFLWILNCKDQSSIVKKKLIWHNTRSKFSEITIYIAKLDYEKNLII